MSRGRKGILRLMLAIGLATLVAVPNLAAADDDDLTLPGWYVGPLVGYMQPDSARDADNGLNLHAVLGVTLTDSVALELNGFGTRIKRTSDKGHDAINGGGLDLTLGTPAPGNPFFFLGGGAVQQELAGVKKSNSFGELGLGVYLPFSFFGELWRLEGRYGVIFNKHPNLPAEDLLEDGRVNFGFLIPFGRHAVERPRDLDSDGDGVPDSIDKCPGTAPGLLVGPDGCVQTSAEALLDSDGDGIPDAMDKCPQTSKGTAVGADGCSTEPDADEDGVPDSKDQCPNSPKWARVDAKGCIPDSDGDGVDDARDDCPDTAPGVTVDRHGCVPLPAPIGDEDHDGVADNVDACPHTAPRTDIDARGCLIPTDVTVKNVHFELNSARLTGDGYILLRQIAAAMKAEPSLRYEVAGYADGTGTKKFNIALSKERAEVVRDFLTYAGVPESQLTIAWHGFDDPTATNNHPEGRAYNRRVEFHKIP